MPTSNTMLIPSSAASFMPNAGNLGCFIINPNSNKALDVQGGESENNTKVQIWQRNFKPAQEWILRTDGTIVHAKSGKVLQTSINPYDGGTAFENGTGVEIAERKMHNGPGLDVVDPSQKWEIQADGHIIHVASGLALDILACSTESAAHVGLWERNISVAQTWKFVTTGTPFSLINCEYKHCALDVAFARTKNGSPVVLHPRNRTPAQMWVYTSSGCLKNPNSNRVLSVKEGHDHATNGTKICIWEEQGNDDDGLHHQQWSFAPDGSIIHVKSGKALSVGREGKDIEFGLGAVANMELDCRTGSCLQKWTIQDELNG